MCMVGGTRAISGGIPYQKFSEMYQQPDLGNLSHVILSIFPVTSNVTFIFLNFNSDMTATNHAGNYTSISLSIRDLQ